MTITKINKPYHGTLQLQLKHTSEVHKGELPNNRTRADIKAAKKRANNQWEANVTPLGDILLHHTSCEALPHTLFFIVKCWKKLLPVCLCGRIMWAVSQTCSLIAGALSGDSGDSEIPIDWGSAGKWGNAPDLSRDVPVPWRQSREIFSNLMWTKLLRIYRHWR